MEIVLAFLLLFGGFTLGSMTADKSGDASRSTQLLSERDNSEDSPPIPQALYQSDPTRCHSDRGPVYRDLSVPYPGKDGPAGDCGGRDCSYNPSAFPPSLEVRSPDE